MNFRSQSQPSTLSTTSHLLKAFQVNHDFHQLCSYLCEISFISGNQFTSSRASFAVRQEIEKGLRAVDSNAEQPLAVNIIISAIITTIVVVNIINRED